MKIILYITYISKLFKNVYKSLVLGRSAALTFKHSFINEHNVGIGSTSLYAIDTTRPKENTSNTLSWTQSLSLKSGAM